MFFNLSSIFIWSDVLTHLRDQGRFWWAEYQSRWFVSQSCYETAGKWINWHCNEQKRGYAILQRIQQLSQDSEVYRYSIPAIHLSPSHSARGVDSGANRRRPIIGHNCVGLANQELVIKRLRWRYRIHQEHVALAWRHRPRNAVMDIYELRSKPQDEDGRSYWWYRDSELCADAGGCCARSCGCCEKPLHEYFRPSKRGLGERELTRVYGHCTTECGCCVITYGVYAPDSRLPRPNFTS